MDLIPCSANAARGREVPHGLARARRLVRVKFVSLPMEPPAPRRHPLVELFSRVIGRLVAARP